MGQGPTLDLGPCQIEFNGVELGETFGDVIFKYTEETRPVHEDSKGVSPIDEIHVGMNCEVEVPLTRMSLEQLVTPMPAAVLNSDESGAVISSLVGSSLANASQKLVLKPLVGGVAGSEASWLTIFKAAPKVDIEITYNNEKQRVYKTMFKAFVDDRLRIFRLGYATPVIDTVDDGAIVSGATALVLAGVDFKAIQGTGKLELASAAVYSSATKVAQTVTGWTDTAITFTAVIGALTPGVVYAFVTDSSGKVSTGKAVTIAAA